MFSLPSTPASLVDRLQHIDMARKAVMVEGRCIADLAIDAANPALRQVWQERSWIEQSWRRCLAAGHSPDLRLAFDMVPYEARRRTQEANHALLSAARTPLQNLGQAIADTRYFALMTDANGIVIDAGGVIDRSDARASVITRIGTDLSERSIGTSAIGTALHEHKSVWLHRGEHFFADTSVYSCAGAPLWSPQGHCVGMLDLTGIDAQERPELAHLVTRYAKGIENAMVEALPYALMIRINWPGQGLGDASDGLLVLDSNGAVLGFNQAAKQILGIRVTPIQPLPGVCVEMPHANDLFALPFERLFDAARAGKPCTDVPLWSGLRVDAEPLLKNQSVQRYQAQRRQTMTSERLPLREVASTLIKQTVQDTKGNVAEAARKLGISRATLYRKLAPKGALKAVSV
jgi:sigma-54 dependent transcriptional regulator, acetoin dehydrogenase operon transcriptional activator AcoR